MRNIRNQTIVLPPRHHFWLLPLTTKTVIATLQVFVCPSAAVGMSSTGRLAVASLPLVSPGVVTDGVTLYFFSSKSDDLFQSSSIITTPTPTPPSTDLLSNVLCKFSRQKITLSLRCQPLDGVTRGGPLPSPSDATVALWWIMAISCKKSLTLSFMLNCYLQRFSFTLNVHKLFLLHLSCHILLRSRRGFTLGQGRQSLQPKPCPLQKKLCLQQQYAVVRPANSYTGSVFRGLQCAIL